MKKLEESLEIIVHIPHFTDAKTEGQGHKASQLQSGTVSWVCFSVVLGELSAACQSSGADQDVEPGLGCNGPCRG